MKNNMGYELTNGKYEHRVIYEKHYNVTLTSEDIIHHRDGDRSNNDINNLFRFYSTSDHMKYHWFIATQGYLLEEDYVDMYL